MKQKLDYSPSIIQSLKVTAELKMALHVLSLPIVELSEFISKEIEGNPLFELNTSNFSCGFSIVSNEIPFNQSTYEKLLNQTKYLFRSQEDLMLAKILIGSLDNRGFLCKAALQLAEDFSVDVEVLKKVQNMIMKMEPLGIASEGPREFLLLQLEEKGLLNTLSYKILEKHYDDFILQRYSQICKKLKISKKALQKEIDKVIKKLILQPLISNESNTPLWARPDIKVVEEDNTLKIYIDEEEIYPVNISSKYEKILTSNSLDSESKSTLIKALSSGNWLIKNLQMRKKTLYEITKYLIKTQKKFFSLGVKPETITIQEVSKGLSLSLSTISRAIQNKYIDTPFGMYPLKFFFTHTCKKNSFQSSILLELKKIIETEDKTKPLTDEQICKKLLNQGIKISRRCVSKYRQKLSITSAKKRRKYT